MMQAEQEQPGWTYEGLVDGVRTWTRDNDDLISEDDDESGAFWYIGETGEGEEAEPESSFEAAAAALDRFHAEFDPR